METLSHKSPDPRAQALLYSLSGKNNYLLLGGANRNEHFGDVWLFQVDPTAKLSTKFLRLGSTTLPRSGHAGGLDPVGDLYWFGGQDVHTGQLYNDIGMLDHTSLECANVKYEEANIGKTVPIPRNSHSFCCDLKANAFVLFGGAGAIGDMNDLFVYSVATKVWEKRAVTGEWPAPREMHVAHTYGNAKGETHMMVLGGKTAAGISDEVWDYNVALNVWSKRNCLPSGLAAAGSTIVRGRYIVAHGGTDGTGFLNAIWVYDIETEKCVRLGPEKYLKNPAGKISPSVAANEDCVVIFGGCGLEQEFDTVEVLSVDTLLKDAGFSQPDVQAKLP